MVGKRNDFRVCEKNEVGGNRIEKKVGRDTELNYLRVEKEENSVFGPHHRLLAL